MLGRSREKALQRRIDQLAALLQGLFEHDGEYSKGRLVVYAVDSLGPSRTSAVRVVFTAESAEVAPRTQRRHLMRAWAFLSASYAATDCVLAFPSAARTMPLVSEEG